MTPAQFTYIDPTLGYSLQLPTGWVAAPQAVRKGADSSTTVFTNAHLPGTRINIDVVRDRDFDAGTDMDEGGNPSKEIGGFMGGDQTIQDNTPADPQSHVACVGWKMVDGSDIVTGHWCSVGALDSPVYAQRFEDILETYHNYAYIYGTTYTSLAPMSDGRLVAFTLGADQNIWYASQTTPGGYWSRWTPLQAGRTFLSRPVVSVGSSDSMAVYALGSDHHIWESRELPSGWSSWELMQGAYATQVTPPQFQGPPSITTNSVGLPEIVARGVDGRIWENDHARQDFGWNGWKQFSTQVVSGDPVIQANADSMLEVFVLGSDGNLWTRWESVNADEESIGWTGYSWSNWVPLPGGTGMHFQGKPATALNADGRLEVVMRKADGTLWHNFQTVANGSWSGWMQLTSQPVSGDPVIGANADGHLEVFARGMDNNVYHTWETVNGSSTSWSRWVLLQPGSHYQFQGTPALALNADGRLKVSIPATNDSMWTNVQITPNGSWSGWSLFHLDPTLNGHK